ncbi:MAG: cytochrome c oxidase assembly protein [Bordetella sp.]|nr:MAG: cytochrome c oxidase assembly protein [Bordetella sp.]
MNSLLWFIPWEFSPSLIVIFFIIIVLFIKGQKTRKISITRKTFFWMSIALLYLALHSKLDYYAERVFFIHRIQHLVLHHIGPLLFIISVPGPIIRSGLSMKIRFQIRNFFKFTFLGCSLIKLLTHKMLVPILFTFLVLIWLVPSVQFYSMLDWRLYRLMNWSVVISGVMYWNIILDNRISPPSVMSPGFRVISPVLTMIPQMIVGAIIAFSEYDLYPLFELCGRATNITQQTDQVIGGLTIWIPAAFVEVIGMLIALKIFMNLSKKGKLENKY